MTQFFKETTFMTNIIVTTILWQKKIWNKTWYFTFYFKKNISKRKKTNFVTNNLWTNYYDKIFFVTLNLLTNADGSGGRTDSRAWEPIGRPFYFLNTKHLSPKNSVRRWLFFVDAIFTYLGHNKKKLISVNFGSWCGQSFTNLAQQMNV